MYNHTRYTISDLFQISAETRKHIHEHALEDVFGYSEDKETDKIREMRENYEKGMAQGIVFALEYMLGEWE